MHFLFILTLSGLATLTTYNSEHWILLPNTSTPSSCSDFLTPHEAFLSFPMNHLKYDDKICARTQSKIVRYKPIIDRDEIFCKKIGSTCKLYRRKPMESEIDPYSPLRSISCKLRGGNCRMVDKRCKLGTDPTNPTCSRDPLNCDVPNLGCTFLDVVTSQSDDECVLINRNIVLDSPAGDSMVFSPIQETDIDVSFYGQDPGQPPATGGLRLAQRGHLFAVGSEEGIVDKDLLAGTIETKTLTARLKLHDGRLIGGPLSREEDGDFKEWCFRTQSPYDCSAGGGLKKLNLQQTIEWHIPIYDKPKHGVSIAIQGKQWTLHPTSPWLPVQAEISHQPIELPEDGSPPKKLRHFAWTFKTSKTPPPTNNCPVPYSETGITSFAGGGVFCPIDRANGG